MPSPFAVAAIRRALRDPAVAAVDILDRFPASTAEVAGVLVRFADTRPPRRMIAKHASGDGRAAAARELRFYRQLAPRWPSPAPALLGSHDDGAAVLLLTEDLVAAGYTLRAAWSPGELDATIDTLVRLHAAFWNDVTAALPVGPTITQSAQAWPSDAIIAHAATLAAAPFGDPADRAILAEVLPAWAPRFLERVAAGRALTVGHGDFHLLGNIFFAADSAAHPPRVIDWSEIKPALPTHDLAYVLHAAPAPDRAARDRALLRRYHAGLLAAGVTDYPWPLCQWDHAFSLITCLFQAVLQNSPRWFRVTAELVDLHDARAALHTPPPR